MGFKWEELENRKTNAFNDGQIEYALFWQNEQIMKKLGDLNWILTKINEGK